MPSSTPTREILKRDLLELDPFGTYQQKAELYEPFLQRPVLASTLDVPVIQQTDIRLWTGANRDWNIEGTNAADVNSELDPGGGVALATTGNDDDQIILVPADPINGIAQSPWGTMSWGDDPRFEGMFFFQGAIADFLFQHALALTPTLDIVTDDDQLKFQASTDGLVSTTNYTVIQSVGGVDTEIDTGVAIEGNKRARLCIEIDDRFIPQFLIDGVSVYTGVDVTAGTGIPPAFSPFTGLQALTAQEKRFFVRLLRGTRDWRNSA